MSYPLELVAHNVRTRDGRCGLAPPATIEMRMGPAKKAHGICYIRPSLTWSVNHMGTHTIWFQDPNEWTQNMAWLEVIVSSLMPWRNHLCMSNVVINILTQLYRSRIPWEEPAKKSRVSQKVFARRACQPTLMWNLLFESKLVADSYSSPPLCQLKIR